MRVFTLSYPVAHRSVLATTLHGSQRSVGRGGAVAIPWPRPVLPPPSKWVGRFALAPFWAIAIYEGMSWWSRFENWYRPSDSAGDGWATEEYIRALALNGWENCGVCSIDNGVSHQWPRNISLSCDQVTDLCLAGQALDGQARPLGEAVPATWGLLEFITNTPRLGASPWRITYAFVRPVPHDTVPPMLSSAVLPRKARYGWFGGSPFPGDLTRTFPIPIPVHIKPVEEITPFPETNIWGPRARSRPGVAVAAGSGIEVRAAGKSWVINGRTMQVTEVVPRVDAQVRQVPKPHEKEAKLRVSLNGYAIGRILSLSTEGADIVEALHKALDPKCMAGKVARGRRDWYEKRRVGRMKQKLASDRTPQAKLKRVYNNMDCMNGSQALWNLFQNEVVDRALGKYGQALRRANQKAVDAGYLYERPGFQVGPWDTVTRDNRLKRAHSDRNREERQLP